MNKQDDDTGKSYDDLLAMRGIKNRAEQGDPAAYAKGSPVMKASYKHADPAHLNFGRSADSSLLAKKRQGLAEGGEVDERPSDADAAMKWWKLRQQSVPQ